MPLELQSESGISKWCPLFVCKWILSSLFSSHHTWLLPSPPNSSPPLHLHRIRLGKCKTWHLSASTPPSPSNLYRPYSATQLLRHKGTFPSGTLLLDHSPYICKSQPCHTDHTWASRAPKGRVTSSPSYLPTSPKQATCQGEKNKSPLHYPKWLYNSTVNYAN